MFFKYLDGLTVEQSYEELIYRSRNPDDFRKKWLQLWKTEEEKRLKQQIKKLHDQNQVFPLDYEEKKLLEETVSDLNNLYLWDTHWDDDAWVIKLTEGKKWMNVNEEIKMKSICELEPRRIRLVLQLNKKIYEEQFACEVRIREHWDVLAKWIEQKKQKNQELLKKQRNIKNAKKKARREKHEERVKLLLLLKLEVYDTEQYREIENTIRKHDADRTLMKFIRQQDHERHETLRDQGRLKDPFD